ncbi:MAG: pyrimidine reductase family protein [Chloroflexota bacterium]
MLELHGFPRLSTSPPDARRPYVATNMIASVDGRTTLNGSAVGIGSALDKRLLYELRAEADVVLHGAGTVRADPLSARVPADLVEWRRRAGLSDQPLGAIVTRSGALPAEHPYYDSPTVIYLVGDGRVELRSPNVDIQRVAALDEIMTDLGRRGVRRILCEGGPTLNASLLDAGLLDEIFLTIAPKLLGGHAPLTLVKGGRFDVLGLELRSHEVHDGELFLKYGVRRPSASHDL